MDEELDPRGWAIGETFAHYGARFTGPWSSWSG
jgi:hypothetical protein